MSVFQAIIDVAGRGAAERVAYLKGGEQVYIPFIICADHWLAKAIGLSHATAIASEFGGCRVEIPTDVVQRRHAAIAALFRRGLSTAEVARELKINVRTARRHRQKDSASRHGATNPRDKNTGGRATNAFTHPTSETVRRAPTTSYGTIKAITKENESSKKN